MRGLREPHTAAGTLTVKGVHHVDAEPFHYRRFPVAGALVLAPLLLLLGCGFTRGRLRDAEQMLDAGITVTERPSLSVYGCGAGLVSFGYGEMDGRFIGVGGGRAGVYRHYHRLVGVVAYGHEVVGWGRDNATARHKGLVGWLFFRGPRAACVGPL